MSLLGCQAEALELQLCVGLLAARYTGRLLMLILPCIMYVIDIRLQNKSYP